MLEVGEPCPGRRVVVVEVEGDKEEPCLAAGVVVVVVVVSQASNLILQVAVAAAVVVEEEGEVAGVPTKVLPQGWSNKEMEAEEEEEVVAVAVMQHLVAFGIPVAPGRSAWPYPLWPAVRPPPDDHHSIWRTPASG